MTPLDTLRSLGACDDAIKWGSRRRRRDQSPQALWDACPRGDWLAWYLGRLAARDGYGSPAHRRAVLIACLCARTASHRWRGPACERAVALAERWAWGDETVTLDDLRATADAAATYAAADATADAAATYAAADAAATYAAATYAAYAAAHDDAAALTAHLAGLADMIRAAVPEVPA